MTALKSVLVAVAFSALCLQATSQRAPADPGYKIKKETLKKTLETIGYQAKDIGNGFFSVTIDRPDDSVDVYVTLSGSLSKVWLTSPLGTLDAAAKGDAAYLLKLLEKNGEVQPAHFFVRKSRLSIGEPLDNRVTTPANLKKEIEAFADTVVKTRETWSRGA